MTDVLSVVSNLFKPVSEFIDDSSLSAEERRQFQKDINELQFGIHEKFVEYKTELLSAQAKVIGDEAKSESWLTASWRPLVMLCFMLILIGQIFGWVETQNSVDPEILSIIKFGLSGYIGGRSVEKVTNNITKMIQYKK